MKAIGFTQHLDINDPESLFEFEKPVPSPKGHDLLVKVNAVSVNLLILVYDAVGVEN